MPSEVARCLVCGKVELVDEQDAGHIIDMGAGIQVVDIPDLDDPPLYWPDGMALAACPIHTVEEMMAAFNKYPESHWLEGKPNAGN